MENFDLQIADRSSLLLIGSNGAGKTTTGLALEILQKIARGTNRLDDVVKLKDFTRGLADAPMRIELEAELTGQIFKYFIALEFPPGFKELRVMEEGLLVDNSPVFTRDHAQVQLGTTSQERGARFLLDWHLAALPIVQESTPQDPLFVFKQWLARTIILRPIPALIKGHSEDETLRPNTQGTDFGAWFSGLLAYAPAAYAKIDSYLRQVMPDFTDIKNPLIGKGSRSMEVQFATSSGSLVVPFEDLSDGEKCFMLSAIVLAANDTYGPLVCFWDEPDSHLALSEVGHFITALRKAFRNGGQFIATSHNPEAIRRFSDENTVVLYRESHLEPTLARALSELKINGELVGALIRGDVPA